MGHPRAPLASTTPGRSCWSRAAGSDNLVSATGSGPSRPSSTGICQAGSPSPSARGSSTALGCSQGTPSTTCSRGRAWWASPGRTSPPAGPIRRAGGFLSSMAARADTHRPELPQATQRQLQVLLDQGLGPVQPITCLLQEITHRRPSRRSDFRWLSLVARVLRDAQAPRGDHQGHQPPAHRSDWKAQMMAAAQEPQKANVKQATATSTG